MTGALGRLALSPVAWALALAPVGALSVLLADRTNPAVPLVALFGIGAVLLAYTQPLLALLAAIALVPLEVFAIPLGGIGLSPSEMLFVVTALVWAVSRLAAGHAPWISSPVSWPLLLLWLAALPALAVAQEPDAVLRFMLFWGCFVLLFALIAAEADLSSIRTLLFGLAVVGAIVAGAAVLGSAGTEQELSATGDVATGRARGAFGSPNILGTFLAMTLPLAVLAALEGRWRRAPVAIAAVGLIFAALALSLSRGGIFAAAGALMLMLAWPPVRRLAAIGVVVLVGVTVLNANPLGDVRQVEVVLDRVQSVRLQSASSTDQRTLIYSETPRMIEDHLLTGVGALNYPNVAPRYGIVEPRSGATFEHAHNIGLTIGAELGLLGLIALAWLLVALVRLVPRVCGRGAGPNRGIGLAVTGGLVAVGLQGLIDFTLRSNVIAAITFVLLGSFAALARATPGDGSGGSTPAAPARAAS
ncbi:MAG: O-antigen ligase family protein [Actinomycetota bacterium]|nr:O-antigen ligase family protein [Actinomycetota bacterium]